MGCILAALVMPAWSSARPGQGWPVEAVAKEVPSLHPGFGDVVAASASGLVAMSSARDADLGTDAAMVAVRMLRRGRFEPAGLAHHPGHRTDSGFGMALAIDDDGTLFVGAPDTLGGSVFVFERPEVDDGTDDGLWTPVAELRAPTPQAGARFGASVAVSGHGQGRRVIVGEPDRDVRALPGIAGFRAGMAHVFERRGDRWSHAGSLSSPEPGTTARFGSAVAISGDTVVIGAPGASREVDRRTLWSCGDAWSGHRVDGQWRMEQRLHAPQPSALAGFGSGVAFDGVTIAVTAVRDLQRRDARGPGAPRRGAVHLYERSRSGWPADPASRAAPWRPVQRLSQPGDGDEHFAAAVSLRDGVIAIGAPAAGVAAGAAGSPTGDRAGDSTAAGCAYVYEKVHANTWVLRARCAHPEPAEGMRDGAGVAIARRSDGCIGLVMSRGGNPDDPPGPGAVCAFTPLPMAAAAIPARWLAGTA